jgi:DNA repair exonuclease SbcCD ATPase subunit
LHGEVSSKNTQIGEKDTQIAIYRNDLEKTRKDVEKKDKQLEERDKRIETLDGLFNNLRIESSNIISNKDKEIEVQSRDIKSLKGNLERLEEENLNQKFEKQDRELDEFVQKVGISRQKFRDLRKAYLQLIRSQENCNQEKIDEAEDNISEIKDELLEGSGGWLDKRVNLEDVRELCDKCREFTLSKVAKEKRQAQKQKQQQEQQQQYEARQEVPPHNNNN